MAKIGLIVLLIVSSLQIVWGADSLSVDSVRLKVDTIFVIPAGPVAGTFTPASRIAVVDTIAGWAKISVEGWVPVTAVMDRLAASPIAPSFAPFANPPSGVRQQCIAITKKGSRCTRRAMPGSPYCWQHSPERKN